MSDRTGSGRRRSLAAAHGRLWYGEAGYRLAWLALPQAGAVVAAGLLLAVAGRGEWGRPATGSPQRVAALEALRQRAGREGDLAALKELTAAAEAGEIDAATRLASLVDPLVAKAAPRSPAPRDSGRAAALYRPGAAAGDIVAIARLADLLMEDGASERERRQGCRLGLTWLDHPRVNRDMLRGEERLAEKIARCLVDPQSGVAQDPDRAGSLVVDTLRLKYDRSIRQYVYGLGLQKPELIRGMQRELAARRPNGYTGPIDGRASGETVLALEREAELRPFPPQPRSIPATQTDAEQAFRSLVEAARRDAGARARLQAMADRGDAKAMSNLGGLYSPVYNRGEFFAPDARRAAQLMERAAASGSPGTGIEVASLYDKGPGNLARDPAKAAALAIRAIAADPSLGNLLTDPDMSAGWSPAFWGGVQRELKERGFYTNPIEDRRNDALILAIRQFLRAQQGAAAGARPGGQRHD
ncbi:hypothetical protein [uncultured Methylobacterium sp.]|uniref:hypothetical protein n=1 Tax=uncultured Methylobacterium sp. TaxID=157278 RepID=UPI002582EC06|nr:hypothetical protein [uncultured Methylobacterium sp.]